MHGLDFSLAFMQPPLCELQLQAFWYSANQNTFIDKSYIGAKLYTLS